MIRSALTGLALSASVYAGGSTPPGMNLGDLTPPTLGLQLGMPALALIGAVGLIAGIRYLRNKRS